MFSLFVTNLRPIIRVFILGIHNESFTRIWILSVALTCILFLLESKFKFSNILRIDSYIYNREIELFSYLFQSYNIAYIFIFL